MTGLEQAVARLREAGGHEAFVQELARHFDDRGLNAHQLCDLAQDIQTAVEDFFWLLDSEGQS